VIKYLNLKGLTPNVLRAIAAITVQRIW